MSPVFQGALGLCILGAVIYTVITRSQADFWRYSFIVGGVVGIFLTFGALAIWYETRAKLSPTEILGGLLVIPVLAIVGGAMYYSLAAALKAVFFWARDPSSVSWKMAFAGFLVLAFGSMLFYFRLRLRSVYGATEALVGIFIGMQRLLGSSTNPTGLNLDLFLPLLTASVYLVVRGFDNVHKGIVTEPYDPIGTVVWAWIQARSPEPASKLPAPSQPVA